MVNLLFVEGVGSFWAGDSPQSLERRRPRRWLAGGDRLLLPLEGVLFLLSLGDDRLELDMEPGAEGRLVCVSFGDWDRRLCPRYRLLVASLRPL